MTASRRGGQAGITLVEITIILAVLAVLSAALAPVAARTIDRARDTRAVTDVKAIRSAILSFFTDMTAYSGFTINGAAGIVNGLDTVFTLVGDGDTPVLGTNGGVGWSDAVNLTTGLVDFFGNHLVQNNPRGNAANAYPTIGVSVWRGAYLTGPVDPDPWGNRYAANVRYLKNTPQSNDVIVLSAGPDEEINTGYAVDGMTPGNDDIMVVVRRDPGMTVP